MTWLIMMTNNNRHVTITGDLSQGWWPLDSIIQFMVSQFCNPNLRRWCLLVLFTLLELVSSFCWHISHIDEHQSVRWTGEMEKRFDSRRESEEMIRWINSEESRRIQQHHLQEDRPYRLLASSGASRWSLVWRSLEVLSQFFSPNDYSNSHVSLRVLLLLLLSSKDQMNEKWLDHHQRWFPFSPFPLPSC